MTFSSPKAMRSDATGLARRQRIRRRREAHASHDVKRNGQASRGGASAGGRTYGMATGERTGLPVSAGRAAVPG